MTESHAQAFAHAWIAAWNARNLERVLEHYAETIEFTSPFAVQLARRGGRHGLGKAALRAYFQEALDAYPDLHFEFMRVLTSVNSITIYYRSVRSLYAAEVMLFDADGKVARVLAHYAAE